MLFFSAISDAIWDLVSAFAIMLSVRFVLLVNVYGHIKAVEEQRAKRKPCFY
jgi:hypothetical protein